MNRKLIFEIGDIIHVRNKLSLKAQTFIKKLTPKEIVESYEFKKFIENYPELRRLALE